MADMLNTAVSGLLSYQRALSTTSHNISNVNTEGYSRQLTSLETRFPSRFGDNFIGTGVQVQQISRAYDNFLTESIRESQSQFSRQDMFYEMASQIDDILADPVGGISPILQEFFTAVQDVADDPASSTARSQMITTADSLINRFQTFNTRFDDLTQNTATSISDTVNEINDIVEAIQEVNVTLTQLNPDSNIQGQPADLLDRRDALLKQLSERIDINVVNPQDNNITVLIGNGQTVLNGSQTFKLATVPDPADASREIIVYQGFTTVTDISNNLTGGELGGLLDFQNNVLLPTRNSLGRIAVGFAQSFNQQHNAGMDLQGNLGGDFFSVDDPQVISFTSNTGNSTVTATVTDVTQLTSNDYELRFDGANWQVFSSDGSQSASTPPFVATDTLINFDGIEFNIDLLSSPLAGDRFTIRPTFSGARTLDLVVRDPNQIAAATPIRTLSSDANLGSAEIGQSVVTDAADANLLETAVITFTSPTTFDVSSPTAAFPAVVGVAYTNGMNYSLNGWQVNLTGNPQTGDTLIIESNAGGVGDNRNMLALAQLQTTSIFNNSTANYQEAYAIMTGQVGSQTLASEIDRDAQQTLLTQITERRDSVSGVNLDEEAANLIKYQQAYEATARVISTVQNLFDTLLNAFR